VQFFGVCQDDPKVKVTASGYSATRALLRKFVDWTRVQETQEECIIRDLDKHQSKTHVLGGKIACALHQARRKANASTRIDTDPPGSRVWGLLTNLKTAGVKAVTGGEGKGKEWE
jgi:hypothetical protein